MTTGTSASQNLGLFDRLSVKLLALFVATFLIAFLALWGYGISTSYLESAVAEQTMVQRPQQVVIDPKLRDELNAVMAFDATAEPPAIKDPFNDRAGIGGLSAAQSAVGGAAVTRASGTSSGTGNTGSRTTTVGGSSGSAPSAPELSGSEGTRQRYAAWLGRASTGYITLDPRIFSIEDLLPVGVVDGGSGSQEVLFYSAAAERTVSFPIGTVFYDGWLTELRPEGVVFASGDERRTIRLRSWARALKSVG